MKIIKQRENLEMYNLKLEKAEHGCFSCDSFHPLMTSRTLSSVIVSIWCLAVCVVELFQSNYASACYPQPSNYVIFLTLPLQLVFWRLDIGSAQGPVQNYHLLLYRWLLQKTRVPAVKLVCVRVLSE